ncbi:hypothetical protein, partial [Klebsiella sp. Kps]
KEPDEKQAFIYTVTRCIVAPFTEFYRKPMSLPSPPDDQDEPIRQSLDDAHFAIVVLAVTSVTLIIFVLLITLWMS